MKKIFRHTALRGLMLAAAIGLAPAVFSQGVDTERPVVSFSPKEIKVKSGAMASVTLTATDNFGIADLEVTCTQGGFSIDDSTYTAPAVNVDTTATCTAQASDAAGNSSASTLTVSITATAPDTENPVMSFSPNPTKAKGERVSVTLAAKDNVGVTRGPIVTCNWGSFSVEDNTYTAPAVTVDTVATCTAQASDAADNSSEATLDVSITATARDTTPPVITFSPEKIEVDSGETASVTLTATDNVGVTRGPTVTCVEGSFADNTYTAPHVDFNTADDCEARARDAAGNKSVATLTVSIIAPDTTPPVLFFSPATLTVNAGVTVAIILTVTEDNASADEIKPKVSCDKGSFNVEYSTYTAPAVGADLTGKCTAWARDAAGNPGRAELMVKIIGTDIQPPNLHFDPSVLTVKPGAAAASVFTARDNVGITRGPVVTCDQGSFADDTYTAPAVSVNTRAECKAWAEDAAGNTGAAALIVSIFSDEKPPDVSFEPNTLIVKSGGTARSRLTATDNIGIRGRPKVTCTQGGSFSVDDNAYTAPHVNVGTAVVCTAWVKDTVGNTGTGALEIFVTAPDKKRPTLSFRPSDLIVDSGATATVTFMATDNVGVKWGPKIGCYPLGSFDVDDNTFTYTAPHVNADTRAWCRAWARDAAGNASTASLQVYIRAADTADTTPPVVSFSHVSLTVASGGTGMSQVSATDDGDGNPVLTVLCTNGGSYDTGMGVFTAPTVAGDTLSICTVTATDDYGNSGLAMLAVNITPPAASCPVGFTESVGSPLGGQTLCTGPLGNLAEFAGVLTQNATIPYVEGVVYELGGRLDVGVDGGKACAGVTPVVLTVEAGVTIAGDSGDDLLVVNRCHRIAAAGTVESPIVFTSRNDIAGTGERADATGEWGGVVVLGNAPINRCDGAPACEHAIEDVTVQGTNALYGGGTGKSGSGTLQYVTVRQAGARLNAGLTLGGISEDTTVDHIQVHNSSGDGVAILGGTVKAHHLVLTGNTDDQLHMDEGYDGAINHMVGVSRAGNSSDNGIEISSESGFPISNFTLRAAGNTRGSGIRITAGADPSFRDGIVVDGKTCLDYETTVGDGISFRSVLFDCPNLVTTGAGDDPDTGRNAVNKVDSDNVITMNTLNGFIPGPKERGVKPTDGDYIGAFSPRETNTDNWAAGWTRDLLPEPECPAGTAAAGFDIFGHNVCTIRGTVTDDLRLTRGNLYALLGRVDIGVDMGADGMAAGGGAAALVIEPGVTVFGPGHRDRIVVNRGSTITAEGTQAAPIIFTSVKDVTGAGGNRRNAVGEWGGLVILGRAPINRCNKPSATVGTAACEGKNIDKGVDALYGGAVSGDSSGSLRYVQVKYAGSQPARLFYLRGIFFGGVGSGTTVEYVQVHNTTRYGIGYFGGTVNSRRVVVTGNDAGQLDINYGYRGSIQYVIGIQRRGSGGSSVGVSSGSNPTLSNFTLIGKGDRSGDGIRVRAGATGFYMNGVLTDERFCLRYERGAGDGVEGFTPGSDPAFRSVLFDCVGGLFSTGSDTTTGQAAVDAAGANNVTGVANTLEGFVNGSVETGVRTTPAPRGNTFLETVDYIGAVKNAEDTWWQGWTCGLEESDPC
ncbi:MAG: hypothetical protein GDA35_10385 [Hyphomonadaceae bacterium]|nr:hypothetical protein [Hyphomonadaceae bacterium]